MPLRFATASLVLSVLIASPAVEGSRAAEYCWLETYDSTATIERRIAAPEGYRRVDVDSGSLADWLRGLPLREPQAQVYLYDGRLKDNQEAHAAVLDIDAGTADLQQCADAVIRLRSEYFFSRKLPDSISYEFTSGDDMPYAEWVKGVRPVVDGNDVTWRETRSVDTSYRSFREYLDTVFMYAGTLSLTRSLERKADPCQIVAGDLFMIPGSPGHTVMVVDVAEHAETGERLFLLAQGFMPAQDLHILNNPMDFSISPWYSCDFGEILRTPEYTFRREHLMEF